MCVWGWALKIEQTIDVTITIALFAPIKASNNNPIKEFELLKQSSKIGRDILKK